MVRKTVSMAWRWLSSSLSHLRLLLSMTSVRVDGESMQPALEDGDRLLVSRLAYRLAAPKHGDIVLVRDPSRSGYECIKRILGLPGEMVEDRLLGPEEYFLVGDNLLHSTDSRTYGPVPADAIIGRAWYRYASPTGRRGRL
jgi:signal peptidase I